MSAYLQINEKIKERLVVQEAEVDALEVYLKLAKLRYDNGQNDYLTVIDAETSLFQVQLEAAATQGMYFLLCLTYIELLVKDGK